MRLFTTIAGLCRHVQQQRQSMGTERLGLVPTMGALHAGHVSLMKRARQECGAVVVSIFVNPLQFGPQEDFHRYPQTLEGDRQLCEAAGVDAVFAPTVEELYGSADLAAGSDHTGLTQVLPPPAMMAVLCGPHRPGHFEGVATVVTKLFTIVQPDRAYFGQKDAQQLAILRRLVQDLNLPVTVVSCPTVREADGLAMSSRNRYLSPEERSQAPILYRALSHAQQQFKRGIIDRWALINAVASTLATTPSVRPHYVDLVHPHTMKPLEKVNDQGLLAIAAHVGPARLIDNVLLTTRKPIIAIDGPAGAGKSTVVRRVAADLGLLYLDTGAMYRAVTWLVLHSGIALTDEAAIAELVSQCDIRLENEDQAEMRAPTQKVWINGQEVTREIRSAEVTSQVSGVAAQQAVREALVQQQQAYGKRGGVVMDGRDIGTHVFPDAELKIFLTASVQERARRRHLDLKEQGQPEISLESLEQSIYERDLKDSSRAIAPLRKASDAVEINTDRLTVDQVVDTIVSLYQEAVR
ncbi:MAG: bifunctional pantoate--beta-alanine ligase/(d)CMP kinase [Kaiparowitsia implicata GSE-PSE-MK54-09C]|jgi:pantoate ligase/cytidylate kinase|nr:bifunctional pantoate--beta-alanine ligase/(d)CMP kinase [Kaiparowitsia implicata GSE-PSE-MK54-09C]